MYKALNSNDEFEKEWNKTNRIFGITAIVIFIANLIFIIFVAVVIVWLVVTGIHKVQSLTDCQKQNGTYYIADDSCIKK